MVGTSPCSPALGPGLQLWDKGLDLEMGLAGGRDDLWGAGTALGSPVHRKTHPRVLVLPRGIVPVARGRTWLHVTLSVTVTCDLPQGCGHRVMGVQSDTVPPPIQAPASQEKPFQPRTAFAPVLPSAPSVHSDGISHGCSWVGYAENPGLWQPHPQTQPCAPNRPSDKGPTLTFHLWEHAESPGSQ